MKKNLFSTKIKQVLELLESFNLSTKLLQSQKRPNQESLSSKEKQILLTLIKKQVKRKQKIYAKKEIFFLELGAFKVLEKQILDYRKIEKKNQEKKALEKVQTLKLGLSSYFSNFLSFQEKNKNKSENLVKNYFLGYEKRESLKHSSFLRLKKKLTQEKNKKHKNQKLLVSLNLLCFLEDYFLS